MITLLYVLTGIAAAGLIILALMPFLMSLIQCALDMAGVAPQPVSEAPDCKPAQGSPAKLTVLVIEAHEVSRKFLVDALNYYGSEAVGVASIKHCWPLYNHWRPQLVICGETSCKSKPWQFAHMLLGHDRPNLHTPASRTRPYLVRLTASANRRERSLCEECGFDEYVESRRCPSRLLEWIEAAQQRKAAGEGASGVACKQRAF